MNIKRSAAAGAMVAILGMASSARAYDVATMHPGCMQQRSWCERAAAVSYGDQSRFRNALSAVIALEWVRMVEAAQKVSRVEGYAVRSPSVDEITADLIQAWRVGSSCCDIVLRPPSDGQSKEVSAVGYDRLCRAGSDGGVEAKAMERRCLDALKAAAPVR